MHSAEGWREALESIFKRYGKTGVRLHFRANAAFAKPKSTSIGEHSFLYAFHLPVNDILEQKIKHPLKRPEGELPEKPVIRYHNFQYQAKSWGLPKAGGS